MMSLYWLFAVKLVHQESLVCLIWMISDYNLVPAEDALSIHHPVQKYLLRILQRRSRVLRVVRHFVSLSTVVLHLLRRVFVSLHRSRIAATYSRLWEVHLLKTEKCTPNHETQRLSKTQTKDEIVFIQRFTHTTTIRNWILCFKRSEYVHKSRKCVPCGTICWLLVITFDIFLNLKQILIRMITETYVPRQMRKCVTTSSFYCFFQSKECIFCHLVVKVAYCSTSSQSTKKAQRAQKLHTKKLTFLCEGLRWLFIEVSSEFLLQVSKMTNVSVCSFIWTQALCTFKIFCHLYISTATFWITATL